MMSSYPFRARKPQESSPPDVIDRFIDKYKRDSREWGEYLEHTRRILETAIKEKGIAGVVTGRLKQPDKAEVKLRKRQGFYNYQSDEDILNNLVDFVGLRIAAYFPDDQRRILHL